MASRHTIPALRRTDVGEDLQQVIPKFFEPELVEFQRGKNLDEFMGKVRANKNIRVVAPAGAGKSTDMPVALCKSLGKVVVHCVPSKHLAAHTHDYLVNAMPNDVPRVFVEEVLDEYPQAGIVHTSSAVFAGQSLRWKALGIDPGVVLYLDECHESDGATEMMRNVRHLLHGVSKYIEASATFGSGDSSSRFSVARLPSKVTENVHPFPPVDDWNLEERGVPWGVLKLKGNVLVFTDDDRDAATLVAKYKAVGIPAFRLTARTSIEDFRAAMDVMRRLDGDQVVALVLDYSFRSGFTFKCARILDFGKVMTVRAERGRTVRVKRDLCSFEVYQTKNRGARLPGADCDYWRDSFEVVNAVILAEGVESEVACIWYRMHGFAVPHYMRNVMFAKGKVCKSLLEAFRGDQSLACYRCDQEWPFVGSDRVSEGTASPISLSSDGAGLSDGAASAYCGRSVSRGRTPSVFSLLDDAPVDETMDEERYRDEYRRSMRDRYHRAAGEPPDVPVPSVPSRFGREEPFGDVHALMSRFSVRVEPLKMGEFYDAREDGLLVDQIRNFPDGVNGVYNAAGAMSMSRFLASVTGRVRRDAVTCALRDYNTHTVRYIAANKVIVAARKRMSELDVVDKDGLKEWIQSMRDMLVGSQAVMYRALAVLEAHSASAFRVVDASVKEREILSVVSVWLKVLAACVGDTSGVAVDAGGSDVDLCDAHIEDARDRLMHYPVLSGRMRMRISGDSFREKMARVMLGNRTVEVDALVVPGAH